MDKFSGHKDTDREILNKLGDIELLTVCKINKYFWNQVCNEDFFRNRLLNNYCNIQKNKNLAKVILSPGATQHANRGAHYGNWLFVKWVIPLWS